MRGKKLKRKYGNSDSMPIFCHAMQIIHLSSFQIEKLQQENFELKLKIEEKENASQIDTLAELEIKKVMDELAESGAYVPMPILQSQLPDDGTTDYCCGINVT